MNQETTIKLSRAQTIHISTKLMAHKGFANHVRFDFDAQTLTVVDAPDTVAAIAGYEAEDLCAPGMHYSQVHSNLGAARSLRAIARKIRKAAGA